MRTRFIKDYDVSRLKSADYNPRKLDESKAEKLRYSIGKFGIIKPLIVNGANGVLTAGHQRTNAIKALGIKKVPVIRIESIDRQDEIRFNLFHNSIETNKTPVKIGLKSTDTGYTVIKPEDISFKQNLNPTVVSAISKLIYQYGEWGSIVANQSGKVILNNDYAVAAKLTNTEVICYVVKNDEVKELCELLSIDYGEYYYEKLGIKSYNQLYCQMHRLDNPRKENKSTTYEGYVMPMMNKNIRMLDFGAGRCAYAKKLRKAGYKVCMYEPNFQNHSNNIDIRAVVEMLKDIYKDVKQNGLFDVVVLDSVYNSVVNSEVERYVTLACNCFLKRDGVFITGTRNLGSVDSKMRMTKLKSNKNRYIEFLDKNNFTATYRSGVWTMQHFHTQETLRELLQDYFKEVETYGVKTGSNIYAKCRYPKQFPIDECITALEFELNMEYPNNYRHNRHRELLDLLARLVQERAQDTTHTST